MSVGGGHVSMYVCEGGGGACVFVGVGEQVSVCGGGGGGQMSVGGGHVCVWGGGGQVSVGATHDCVYGFTCFEFLTGSHHQLASRSLQRLQQISESQIAVDIYIRITNNCIIY